MYIIVCYSCLMIVRHSTPDAVVDSFRCIAEMICDGSTDFQIRAGKGDNGINISCYCTNPAHVGMLLGKRHEGVSTPTKKAILRILQAIARRNNVCGVTLKIEDTTKLEKGEDSNG